MGIWEGLPHSAKGGAADFINFTIIKPGYRSVGGDDNIPGPRFGNIAAGDII
jgi:hypothetical protein